MTDERVKQLMEQVGYPESITIQQLILQVANEVEQEARKQAVAELAKQTDNSAKQEIHDCEVCENGTTRLDSFRPDIYRYCPWCSRKLPDNYCKPAPKMV